MPRGWRLCQRGIRGMAISRESAEPARIDPPSPLVTRKVFEHRTELNRAWKVSFHLSAGTGHAALLSSRTCRGSAAHKTKTYLKWDRFRTTYRDLLASTLLQLPSICDEKRKKCRPWLLTEKKSTGSGIRSCMLSRAASHHANLLLRKHDAISHAGRGGAGRTGERLSWNCIKINLAPCHSPPSSRSPLQLPSHHRFVQIFTAQCEADTSMAETDGSISPTGDYTEGWMGGY